jgi:hypothetical protein
VLVLAAPGEPGYIALLKRLDRDVFRASGTSGAALPFEGRKLHVHVDWAAGDRTA